MGRQEWDAKLLGKPAKEQPKDESKPLPPKVKGSQSSLPSYKEATTEEAGKKKIIPVQSDFESSPSPEDPSSPLPSSLSQEQVPNVPKHDESGKTGQRRAGTKEEIVRTKVENKLQLCERKTRCADPRFETEFRGVEQLPDV